jgi:hypothetical protein
MTRDQAKERFLTLYGLGFVLGLLLRLLDPPRVLGIGAAVIWGLALGWFGLSWLRIAVRDGSLQRALPNYGWGFISLIVIAGGCGLIAVIVLAIAGEPVTPTAISTGATLGLLAVLLCGG